MNTTNETESREKPAEEIFSQEEIKEITEKSPEEGTDSQQTANKKELMLKALIKYLGIVSYAAEEIGIGRRTHYNWMKTDAEYKASVELLTEMALDYSESRLFGYIKRSDLKAITFILRTRGKARGYNMYQEKTAERHAAIFNLVVKDKETADMIMQTKENK